jgi:uncharacterized membrane protein (UPF0127 family)
VPGGADVTEPRGGDGGGPPVLRARNLTRGTELAGRVELAASFAARFRGLMGRPSLPPGRGLWLTSASSIHMFFMRFPIDAVFLGRPAADGTRRVVALHSRLKPWTGIVWYARGADCCLELPAGAAAASGTVVGDVVAMVPEPADERATT